MQPAAAVAHSNENDILPARSVIHPKEKHQSSFDFFGRRQIMAGLAAATAGGVNIKVGPAAAKSKDGASSTEVSRQLAVLEKLVKIVRQAALEAKVQAVSATARIKGATQSASQDPAVERDEAIAAAEALAGLQAENAEKALAAEVEAIAIELDPVAQAAARLETAAAALAAAAEGGKEELSAQAAKSAAQDAEAARKEIQAAKEEIAKAKEYAVAAAKAAPRIEKEKQDKKNRDTKAAEAVAITAANKAQESITAADEDIELAAKNIRAAESLVGGGNVDSQFGLR